MAGLVSVGVNVTLAGLFAALALAHVGAARRTGDWATAMPIVVQEGLLVTLFLVRRRSRATSTRPLAWATAIGGTVLPLLLDHMNAGHLTLERLIDLTSTGPARLYGIAGKGRIAVGYDADLTLVDLKARRTIREAWIASRCGWTPFDGMSVTGWPIATVLRGQVVMRDDQLLGTPTGALVKFTETL